MKIIPLSELHYKEVINIDRVGFNRSESRSIENIKTLHGLSENGAFIGVEDDKIISYIFTHCYGAVGTIGPLTVLPEYRNRGIGSMIVQYVCEHLRTKKCTTIGLELLSEKTENVNFYYKLGFNFLYPTVQITAKNNLYLSSSNVRPVKDIDRALLKNFFNDLTYTFNEYSLIKDINWILENYPDDILFKVSDNRIVGFMCFSSELYKYAWGILLNSENMRDTFLELYSRLCQRNNKNLSIRVNTRYKKIIDVLRNDFIIERTAFRMVLKESPLSSFENDNLILRAWIG